MKKVYLFLIGFLMVLTLAGSSAEADGSYLSSLARHHPSYRSYHRTYWRLYSPWAFGFSYSPSYWGSPYGFGSPYYFGSPYSYGSPYYFGRSYVRPYAFGPYRPRGGYYEPAELRIEVKPKDARVYIDGRYAGIVDDYDGWWQRLDVEPGNRRIVIRQQGYRPYAVTMRVMPGQDYHLKHQMQTGDDFISEEDMRGDRDDDDRYDRYGRDDRYDRDDSYRERDRRDRDDDEFERNRRDRYRRNDDDDGDYDWDDDNRNRRRDDSDRDVYREEYRNEDRVALILQMEPSDATIYIDDKYYAVSDSDGEIRIMLPQGVHKLEVVRPGYESFTRQISIGSDEEKNRVVVYLKKK